RRRRGWRRRQFHRHVGVARRMKQVLHRHVLIARRQHRRVAGQRDEGRRRGGGNTRPRERGFARFRRLVLVVQLDAAINHDQRQHGIQQHQFAIHNAPPIFFSWVNFLDTTPESVSRTWMTLFLSALPVIWISLVESSSGWLASAASRFTSCSIRQEKRTVTAASP